MGEIGLGETSFTIMHRASPNLPAPRLRGLADLAHAAHRFDLAAPLASRQQDLVGMHSPGAGTVSPTPGPILVGVSRSAPVMPIMPPMAWETTSQAGQCA
ncbi:hypothetical protein UB46_27680 [Burkholderiaceae bacterium 16]|nr:hypothetical protein UB46_27680 [Burkholderiaceae bacterium 16]